MRQSIVQQIRQDFQPSRLLPSLTAGLISGIITVMVEISLAALIFSGDLSIFIARGIGITLFSSFVIGIVVALTSSYSGSVAVSQDISSAILALAAAMIVSHLPAGTTPQQTYSTVVAMIAISSLLAGACFLLMGFFHLGSLIRFIPYPVIGGFLAGTGWLLIQGAFGVMADVSLSLSSLSQFSRPEAVIRWLPGLVFGVFLYMMVRRYNHFLIIPGILLGTMLLFYVVLWGTHHPLAQVRAEGWMLGPFPGGAMWKPLSLAQLKLVHWRQIWSNAGSLGTILLVSTVSLLLNVSGIELTTRQDMDLDCELRATGLANLLSGLGGGSPGFHALSLSILGLRLNVNSRIVGIVSALLCALTLFVGTPLFSLFPKFIVGGLLLFFGVAFVFEWLYDGWFKMSKGEYAIVALIMVAMNLVGVLEGVGLGILVAVALFVFNYSRTRVVKYALSGSNFRSNVDRPKLYNQLLQKNGERLFILKLQGFIFFGTTDQLFRQVRQRIDDPHLPALQFLVFDFQQVSGMDTSAVTGFSKIKQLAQTRGFVMIFSHLTPGMLRQLQTEVLTEADSGLWRSFADLNYSLEWCEQQLIEHFESTGLRVKARTFLQQLQQDMPSSKALEHLQSYGEQMQVEAGQVLIQQGQPSRGLYFIEAGGAEAILELEDGQHTRLRKMSAGTVVGEVGLYSGSGSTASVVADQPGTVYFLSKESLKQMEEKDPELASILHKHIAQLLSERLVDSTNVMERLLR